MFIEEELTGALRCYKKEEVKEKWMEIINLVQVENLKKKKEEKIQK